jgi:hypothetical protein
MIHKSIPDQNQSFNVLQKHVSLGAPGSGPAETIEAVGMLLGNKKGLSFKEAFFQ